MRKVLAVLVLAFMLYVPALADGGTENPPVAPTPSVSVAASVVLFVLSIVKK